MLAALLHVHLSSLRFLSFLGSKPVSFLRNLLGLAQQVEQSAGSLIRQVLKVQSLGPFGARLALANCK